MFNLNFSKLVKGKKRGNSLTLLLTSATLMSLSMAITSVAVEGGKLSNTSASQQATYGTDIKAADCAEMLENYVKENEDDFQDPSKAVFVDDPSISSSTRLAPSSDADSVTQTFATLTSNLGVRGYEPATLTRDAGETEVILKKTEAITEGGVTKNIVTIIHSQSFTDASGHRVPASISKVNSPNADKLSSTFETRCEVSVDGGSPTIVSKAFNLSSEEGCKVTGNPEVHDITPAVPAAPIKQPLPNTLVMGSAGNFQICMVPGSYSDCVPESGATGLEPLLESSYFTPLSGTTRYVVYLRRNGTTSAQLKMMSRTKPLLGSETFAHSTVSPFSPVLVSPLLDAKTQVQVAKGETDSKFRVFVTSDEDRPAKNAVVTVVGIGSVNVDRKILGWDVDATNNKLYYFNGAGEITGVNMNEQLRHSSNLLKFIPTSNTASTTQITESDANDMSSLDSFVYNASLRKVFWSKVYQDATTSLRKIFSRDISNLSATTPALKTKLASDEMKTDGDGDFYPYKEIKDLKQFGPMVGTDDGRFFVMPVLTSSNRVAIAVYNNVAPTAGINRGNTFGNLHSGSEDFEPSNIATLMVFDNTTTNAINPLTESLENVKLWYQPSVNKFYWMVRGGRRVYEWDPQSWGQGSGRTTKSTPGQTVSMGSVADTGTAPILFGTRDGAITMSTVRVYQTDTSDSLWASTSPSEPEIVFNPTHKEFYIRDNGGDIAWLNPDKGIFKRNIIEPPSDVTTVSLSNLGGSSMAFDKNRGWLAFIYGSSSNSLILTFNPLRSDENMILYNDTPALTTTPAVFYDENMQKIVITRENGGIKLTSIIPQCAGGT